MASTLDFYAPFDSGAGSNVTEDTWRLFMKNNQGGSGVLRGVLNDFTVFADSTGMQVKVQSGECWIQGHWGQKNSTVTLPIAAAHASLARKDRVILRASFTNNRIELDVLTGTASGSPTVPSLTQNSSMWETSLAVVDVPATDTSIDAGQVTPLVNYNSAFSHYRLASAGSQSIANNTLAKVQFPTIVSRCADVTASGTNNTDFTLVRAGEWTINANIHYESTGSDFDGTRWVMIADNIGGSTRYAAVSARPDASDVTLGAAVLATVTERFAANTAFSIWAFQNSGSSINLTATDSVAPVKVSFRWNGW